MASPAAGRFLVKVSQLFSKVPRCTAVAVHQLKRVMRAVFAQLSPLVATPRLIRRAFLVPVECAL